MRPHPRYLRRWALALTMSCIACGGSKGRALPKGVPIGADASSATEGGGGAEDDSGDVDVASAPEGESPSDSDSGESDESASEAAVQNDGSVEMDVSIAVQGLAVGSACEGHANCASALCAGGLCADAASCLTLLQANPGLPSREYEIDPDGPSTGLPPFLVYCDMATDGGGWTALPLLFDDSNFWSRSQAGSRCVTVDVHDDGGNYRQYQSSTDFGFAFNYLRFLPPIAATAVRFVDFLYSNGGSQNTMDFLIGAAPSDAMNTSTSYEGWYFTNPADEAGMPVGYAFPTLDSCVAPYDVEHTDTCSRDTLVDRDGGAPTAPFYMNATIPFSATVASLDMALAQGCGSYPLDPLMDCEQFHIQTPPALDGVWTTGIFVR